MMTNARETARRLLAYLEANRDRLVIDADTHCSSPRMNSKVWQTRLADPDYFHGRPICGEELVSRLDGAKVDMALSWANPSTIPYGEDRAENLEILEDANAYIADLAQRFPTRIIPAGWVDPKATGPEASVMLVRRCVLELGFPVVKMNPAQNGYRIDSEMVLPVLDEIVALGAVPAFHFGADSEFTPADGFRILAERHPEHPIIGVHMGGGGAHFIEADPLYAEARALGLTHPNIFYIFSAKRDTHIESTIIAYRSAGAPWSRNIAAASDAPYGVVSWNFGGFRALLDDLATRSDHQDQRLRANPNLIDPEARTDILGRNLADLVISALRRTLDTATVAETNTG